MWETTKAHVYQSDTWIYAVPKQSLKRPMALQKYVHQNNLVTDLWLYYKVYLAPKQSRNRPMITREYTSVPKQSKQT